MPVIGDASFAAPILSYQSSAVASSDDWADQLYLYDLMSRADGRSEPAGWRSSLSQLAWTQAGLLTALALLVWSVSV